MNKNFNDSKLLLIFVIMYLIRIAWPIQFVNKTLVKS